jgi:16S rRNA (cytidine1402-2'-O)-methyltransferase
MITRIPLIREILVIFKSKIMTGRLYLIPNTLGDCEIQDVIPQGVINIIHSITNFIVEDLRTTRRFLIKTGYPGKIEDVEFYVLNKHTKKEEIPNFLNPCKEGINVGILSEAGVPAVADPGAIVVDYAHKLGIHVVPLTGPSSILLALMASGLNGQNFSFLGYLPVKRHELIIKIKEIEANSVRNKQTQIFIETPYRNMKLFSDLLKVCKSSTYLGIAENLTTNEEKITVKKIGEWKNIDPDLNKKPSVFLILG